MRYKTLTAEHETKQNTYYQGLKHKPINSDDYSEMTKLSRGLLKLDIVFDIRKQIVKYVIHYPALWRYIRQQKREIQTL